MSSEKVAFHNKLMTALCIGQVTWSGWLDQYNPDTKYNRAEMLQFVESHLFIGCDA